MLLAIIWAIIFVANGFTKEAGIQSGDIIAGLAPLVIVPVLAEAGRWVLRGRQQG